MIKSLKAREILDSRRNPTVEVELETNNGIFKASVPSGASRGRYEAVELRDGGRAYQGMGVSKVVKNINDVIAPKLKSKDETEQKQIDQLMIKLDGTKNKSKLGANAILPVSMAVCRAGAKSKTLPLYQYINQFFEDSVKIPRPCFNILNGGVHANNDLDIQEFMVVPNKGSFSKNFQTGKDIYHNLKNILNKEIGKKGIVIGDEGGFAPPINDIKKALYFIMEAGKGYDIRIGLDCAASEIKKGMYHLEFYQGLTRDYPIIFFEDPFAEDDWESFRNITKELNVIIVGDDLLSTNVKRIKQAKAKEACNGAIIKINQIGTITETFEAIKLVKSYGWKIIISHRSGETTDSFIADLAVGSGAEFIKSGAPYKKERLAKYNRLLEIEKELKLKKYG